MGKFKDETGNRYERLLVIEKHPIRGSSGTIRWVCKCDCGKTVIVRGDSLRCGDAKSCGCLSTDLSVERCKTHGLSKTVEYKTWWHMLARCYNPKSINYKYYGERGILVCEEWKDDFVSFYDYIQENLGQKPDPSYSLDRIDNDGNYEPGNIRWASKKQQCKNRRS